MTRLSIKLATLITLILTVISLITFILSPNNSLDIFNESILINYSDGFIRRGLWGEIIKKLHISLNIDVLIFIKYFTLLCYITFCAYMIYLFKRHNISIFFLLLPYVLPFYSLIYYIKIRDFFLLMIFALSALIIKKTSSKITLFIGINLLSIIGILTHEIYLFFSIPLFSILFILKNIWRKNGKYFSQLLYAFLFFTPSILALSASVYYHGDINSVKIIYNDVLNILPHHTVNKDLGGGIGSLQGEATNLIPYMYRDLIWNGFSRGISYTLFFIIILYLFLNFDKLNFKFFKKENLSPINTCFLTSIFLFQSICFLPILIVAIDWQRWLSIIIYTSLITYIQFADFQSNTPPEHQQSTALYRKYTLLLKS